MRVLAYDIGICNFAWCIADVNAEAHPVVVACANSSIGHASDPISVLIGNLAEYLQQHSAQLQDGVETVLIEQQVALRASKNQSLSAALFMFYTNLRLDSHATIQAVRFVNPRAKFKRVAALTHPCLEAVRSSLATAKGRDLKNLSVQTARILTVQWNAQVAIDALRDNRKLDDLSDAVLYACLCA